LRADAVIAVSASGFTEGAEAKATQFGIILRDMDTLTAEEVRDWGKKRKVKAIFYQFTQNVLSVTLPICSAPAARNVGPNRSAIRLEPRPEDIHEEACGRSVSGQYQRGDAFSRRPPCRSPPRAPPRRDKTGRQGTGAPPFRGRSQLGGPAAIQRLNATSPTTQRTEPIASWSLR
jgi:hypothetical protein